MKKILISVAIIILLVLLYMTIVNSLEIGVFKIASIEEIKEANEELDEKFAEAEDGVTKKYPQQVKNLKDAITSLTDAKEEYQSKVQYNADGTSTMTVLLKTYTMEYLYVEVGNYAKKNGLDLKFNLRPGISKGAYNIDYTLTGSYAGLTNFIYDVEDDSYLSYRIENFAITPSLATTTVSTTTTVEKQTPNTNETQTNTTNVANTANAGNTTNTNANVTTPTNQAETTTTSGGDTSKLQVTFTVTEVGIKFN